MSEGTQVVEQPAAPPVPPGAAETPPAAGGETPAQSPAGSAPATPPDGDKSDTPDQAEKRGKSRFERRISRLYREAAEHKARADLLEKQLNEMKPRETPDAGAPRIEQFDDAEKYAEARAKYETDKALREHTARQQSESQKQFQARLAESWEEKTERASDKYEDFDEVVGHLQPTSPWAVALMKAQNGDDVAYHLGKNLKEATRIASLEPVDQILEIGLLAAKLAAEPPKPKTPSKAPAPINPLSGAANVATDVPSESDDMKTWLRKRQKQVHGK